MSHILVIDDEEGVRVVLRRLLQHAAHDVWVAANGNEGLHLCRQHAMDVVITDICMPEKDGLSTIRDFRRNYPHLKIIAISGGGVGSAPDYLKAARYLGAQLAFEKPVEFSLLQSAIQLLVRSY